MRRLAKSKAVNDIYWMQSPVAKESLNRIYLNSFFSCIVRVDSKKISRVFDSLIFGLSSERDNWSIESQNKRKGIYANALAKN